MTKRTGLAGLGGRGWMGGLRVFVGSGWASGRGAAAGMVVLALAVTTAAMAMGQRGAEVARLSSEAAALEQQGKYAEAEAEWRAVLKLDGASAQAYAHLGLLEARQERYEEAVPLYRKALALDARIPGLRLNLGLALFKAGEMKAAAREFSALLKSAATQSAERQRLTILLGMSYYGAEEYAGAATYLKEAAAGDAGNLPLRLALAHSCLWSKQYQCVLDTYHEILMLNAESAEADMLAGEALDELKDSSGAIEQFRAAVKADPKMPDVHFGLGYLLWSKHQYEEAAAEFEAELANNPKHVQALVHLGDAEMKLNHAEAAAPLFEQALAIDSKAELAYLDMGVLSADAGRNEDALRDLKEAEKLAPSDVDVHWRLGRLYRAMGDTQAAKAELEKAKSITESANTALVNKMNPRAAQEQTEPAATGR